MDRKRKVTLLFQNLLESSKKRKMIMEEELEDMCNGAEWDVDDEGVDETIGAVSYAAVEAVANGGRRPNIPRKPNTNRVQQKEVWTNGYRMWDEEQVKSRVRVNRESFEFC